MVVLGQSCCIRAKLMCSGNVFVFGQNCCIWAKMVIFVQRGCIWSKMVLFGKSGCNRESFGIRANWLYLGKVVVSA